MPPTRISCLPAARRGLPRFRPLSSVPPPATEATASSSSSACLLPCQRSFIGGGSNCSFFSASLLRSQRNLIGGRTNSSCSSSSSPSLLQFRENFIGGAPTCYHRRPCSRLPSSCLCRIDVSSSSCLPYTCQGAFHTVAPRHVSHHQFFFRSKRVPYTSEKPLLMVTRNYPSHPPLISSLPRRAAPLSASPTAAAALAAAGGRVGALAPGRRGGALAAAAVRDGGGASAAAVGGGGLLTTAATTAGGGVGGDNSRARQQQRRCMSSHEQYPEELTIGTAGSMDVPVGGAGLYRRLGALGMPMLFITRYDRPTWQPLWEDEYEQMVRDGYGVPGHIPPEVSQDIKHVYHVPPQFYHFLKKLGDDTPALQPYMHKLINGEFTHDDYEEMFYKFAKPLKIYRKQIPMPYRTPEEMAREDEVAWESAWLSYRQRVLAYYNSAMYMREFLFGGLIGIFYAWLFLDGHRQYRLDMKLFYLEAPEHKINWVKPRGDLV